MLVFQLLLLTMKHPFNLDPRESLGWQSVIIGHLANTHGNMCELQAIIKNASFQICVTGPRAYKLDLDLTLKLSLMLIIIMLEHHMILG